MQQQPSCVPVPGDGGLLQITPLLQCYKYVKLEQETTQHLEATKWGRSIPTVNYSTKSQHPARQDLGSLLWHPSTKLCVGRAVTLPSVPAFLPSLLQHENYR